MKVLLTRAILCNFLCIKKLQIKMNQHGLLDRGNVRQPFDYHGKECEMTAGKNQLKEKSR